MSDPQRREVRVRRSPKVGVFLGIGAVLGVLAAIVVVGVSPPDPEATTAQSIGFLAVLLGPFGGLLGGLVALVLDARAERGARTVEAERIAPRVESAPEGSGAAPDPGAEGPRAEEPRPGTSVAEPERTDPS